MGVTLPYTYLQDLEAEIMQNMEACLARVTASGLEGDIVVVHGVPFHEILETAKTQKVDLIVVGTHGRTGLQHILLGSVAEKVVRLAPCPVLVARQPTIVPVS
jgi:nucleotide-binding universal stress UspA family protein